MDKQLNFKRFQKKWIKFSNENGNVIVPNVFFAVHNGETYITKSDHKTVFYFIGENAATYTATKSNCKIIENNGNKIYTIEGTYKLQVISCKGYTDDVENFIIDTFLKK